jgi:hypothetical protein
MGCGEKRVIMVLPHLILHPGVSTVDRESLQVEIWDMESEPSWDMEGEPSDPHSGLVIVSEEECIVSFTTSRDGSKLLLNMANRAVHLWDVPETYGPATLVQKFRGASERHSRSSPPPSLPAAALHSTTWGASSLNSGEHRYLGGLL